MGKFNYSIEEAKKSYDIAVSALNKGNLEAARQIRDTMRSELNSCILLKSFEKNEISRLIKNLNKKIDSYAWRVERPSCANDNINVNMDGKTTLFCLIFIVIFAVIAALLSDD